MGTVWEESSASTTMTIWLNNGCQQWHQQRQQHPRTNYIVIQVITCKHGSYSTCLSLANIQHQSIPASSLSSPRHHLQCCICVPWLHFSQWIVDERQHELLQQYNLVIGRLHDDNPFLCFILANQLHSSPASLDELVSSNTPGWCRYKIFFLMVFPLTKVRACDTSAKKISSFTEDISS